MGTLLKFAGLFLVVAFAVFLAVVTGDYGPWYFAWLVGTVMVVLIAGASAILFDTQEAQNPNGEV